MMSTHHVSHEDNAWVQREYDKQSQMIRDLAAKYDCELVEVREEWRRYLSENQLEIQDLLTDSVHLNNKGNRLMEDLVWRHLRYNKAFPNPRANEIKTVPLQPAADGSFNVSFTGNRVDVVADSTENLSGKAEILVDGQPPSANPNTYTITRPSTASEVWWPGVYTVGFQAPPLVEDWVLKVNEVSDDAAHFKYEVTDSKTGPDGSGSSKETFVSNSGRVVIDPKDFGLTDACAYTKKPCSPGFEIKCSIVPMFKDTHCIPKSNDPSNPVHTTIVQLIENDLHSLEIIPTGNGFAPIKAIRVFQPPKIVTEKTN